jgi:hypothetical protein
VGEEGMTTAFDSFDESPNGSFRESPLGARNVFGRLGIIFIDESSPYLINSIWLADVARYTERRRRVEFGVVVAHVEQPDHTYGSISGDMGLVPDVTVMRVNRQPSVEQYAALEAAAFEKYPTLEFPNSLKLIVDTSGSMRGAETLGPGFFVWLNHLRSLQSTIAFDYPGERWLDAAISLLSF